jgi:glycosyl transferase family 25
MFEFVDKVVYINLDKRIDRRVHMESITSIFGDKVIRFEAIEDRVGIVGCVKSHIAVLNMALDNKWKNVLILEDDIAWNNFQKGHSIFTQLVKNPYDVILLGGSKVQYDTSTLKLFNARTTSAYLVSREYIPTLLDNFETGLKGLLNNTYDRETYSLDTYWNRLQNVDNWYIVVPHLVYQLPGYSDIEGRYMDYREQMGWKNPLLSFLRRRF